MKTRLRINCVYRHVKRGTYYRVLGRAGMQIDKKAFMLGLSDRLYGNADVAAHILEKMSFVVYQSTGEDAELWVRPESEFLDGRFVCIWERHDE